MDDGSGWEGDVVTKERGRDGKEDEDGCCD